MIDTSATSAGGSRVLFRRGIPDEFHDDELIAIIVDTAHTSGSDSHLCYRGVTRGSDRMEIVSDEWIRAKSKPERDTDERRAFVEELTGRGYVVSVVERLPGRS